MASIIGKTVNGSTYYYLAESRRVDGRPRIVSQRYLGTADAIAAAVLAERTPRGRRRHSRQLPYGDVAAAWSTITELRIPGVVDKVLGVRRNSRTREPSPGTLLALAVLRQAVEPSAHLDLAGWWARTRPDRFVRPRVAARSVDDAVFWRATTRLTAHRIHDAERTLAPAILDAVGTTTPLLGLDITDFATYAENRPRGLGLVVTLEGAVPVASLPYAPAELSHNALIERLGSLVGNGITQVIDPSRHPRTAVGDFVGTLPPAEYADLVRTRLGRSEVAPGVTAREMRARVGRRDRRVVVLHSELAHAAQTRALERDLAQATRRLDELGREDPARAEVKAEVARLTARAGLDRELLGRQLLVTSHDDVETWPVERVITAYRARYRLETGLRDAFVPVPAPGLRWTERRIAVHAFVRTLATTVTHLLRHRAHLAGLDLSARDLMERLAEIRETRIGFAVESTGRPRTLRLLTELDADHRLLFDLFGLERWAP